MFPDIGYVSGVRSVCLAAAVRQGGDKSGRCNVGLPTSHAEQPTCRSLLIRIEDTIPYIEKQSDSWGGNDGSQVCRRVAQPFDDAEASDGWHRQEHQASRRRSGGTEPLPGGI